MLNTNGHGLKRSVLWAILYARVSTDEQARSGYSLAQQLEALREYAAREGYEVLEEVQDAGQSGASLERPGMDRVRDLVAAGGVSVVLAQDRDRFAREPAYHYLLRREFEEHGTKIRAMNDRGDDSPEGELTDGILDQLGKYERAKIVERSRRGKLRKAREGKVIATYRPTYGFCINATRDGYEVDEEKMAEVRRVFRMIGAEGWYLRRPQDAGAGGVPAPGGGKYWDRRAIRRCDRRRRLQASHVSGGHKTGATRGSCAPRPQAVLRHLVVQRAAGANPPGIGAIGDRTTVPNGDTLHGKAPGRMDRRPGALRGDTA